MVSSYSAFYVIINQKFELCDCPEYFKRAVTFQYTTPSVTDLKPVTNLRDLEVNISSGYFTLFGSRGGGGGGHFFIHSFYLLASFVSIFSFP